jgi:SAM-dependent methyltransferase
VREWWSAQAARGYLSYDGAGRFSLPDEHAIPLTDETSPACVIGAFEIAVGSVYATDTIAERFRTGTGFSLGAHDPHVLGGCERFFRPGYLNNLTSAWIPALDGVEAKLTAGARIADVGCGHGASTSLLAQAYPASSVVGFDAHQGSVDAARKRAADAGLSDRVRFEVAAATTFDGRYDLVWMTRTEGNRIPHHAVLSRDRDADDRYLLMVEFASYDTGMQNSNRPETSEFAAVLAEISEGPLAFRHLDVIREEDL